MNSQAEQISDEDLASKISDDGHLSTDDTESADQGVVEAGIPPGMNDSAENADTEEEPFSIDDFDEEFEVKSQSNQIDQPAEEVKSDQARTGQSSDTSSVIQTIEENEASDDLLPNGQVSEFRKTLSALSRQLEVDRLTFLYQKLHADGNELPSLDKIASDIRGDSTLHPMGDNDLYSKRPLARLQGWISGLSFGVGRRAKKFSR